MKRLIYTMFLIFCQTFTFAQRGKVRPEWDINGGGSHHSVDDDLYSFLFIVGLVALYFLFLAIRGAFSRSQDTKGKIDHSSFGKTIPKIKESDSFAEKYNNTESHQPFIGEGSNKSYEYARFSFENYNRDFNSLLSIAYDNLNHYFASLGMEYGHGWSWLQTYPPQMRFQHLCISYKTYVLSIIVGLYRETDGHGQLFVNNKDNENLLRECERYNLTPCIFVVDCADGTPRLSEPYLVDARTHEPLNLAKIAEDNDGIMSDWEIHNIGIQCACEYLKKQGITIISYSDVIGIHPQIWFEKDGKRCYALVRSIPAGLHEQKYEITSGQQNRYSEFKGYFFDVHWNMMLGNNGDFRDKRLFREDNPWNLVHRLELKPIEEAIKEYEFIEIVEGESYDIK